MLGINLSDEQFKKGWNSIFKGAISGVDNVLEMAKEKWPLYAFTNSNRTHQKVYSKEFSVILSHFKKVYDSSFLRKRKPEPEAYKTVAKAIGVELRQIAFLMTRLKMLKEQRN